MDASPPSLLGTPFDLVRELGRGKMGVVLEAVDRRNGATCAVKLILPEAAAQDPGLVDRMRLEAEVASTSHSPHIVRVFGSGRTQEGAPYYAMERLVGKTLRE